jgi:hypothetical protein
VDWISIILRVVHIGAGVFWAGWAFAALAVIQPGLDALGADAGRVMAAFVERGRLTARVSAAAGLTVIAGLLLMWRVSGGLEPAFFQTGRGIALVIGAVAGLVAFALGNVSGASARAAMAIMRSLAGTPPSPEQSAELARLQARQRSATTWTAVLLVVTIVGMAAAQNLLI